jgi:hypothetical protein
MAALSDLTSREIEIHQLALTGRVTRAIAEANSIKQINNGVAPKPHQCKDWYLVRRSGFFFLRT